MKIDEYDVIIGDAKVKSKKKKIFKRNSLIKFSFKKKLNK